MYIQKRLIPKSKHRIKAPYNMKIEYITAHNTANDAFAVNEIAYMGSNNNQTSFHFAVDHANFIQGIETNRSAWHAGDGGNGKGNRNSIGVEICFSRSGGARFSQAEKNGAKLIAYLLHKHNLPISRLKKHQDWSRKYCPHRTLDLGWNRFVNMVKVELAAISGTKVQISSKIFEYYSRFNNARHSKVKEIQGNLSKLGFNPGTIDGIFGAKTETAVRSFQRTNALVVDGSVGPDTLKMLDQMISKKPSRSYFKVGDKGDKVKKIQRDLNKLGFKAGEEDGIFGKKTEDAVKKLQISQKLELDGLAGIQTLRRIDTMIKAVDELEQKEFHRVVTGSFKNKKNAETRIKELKEKGFESFIEKYKK